MKRDLFVEKGINESQINELLQYTQEDSYLHEHTNDLKRFATRSLFNKWLEKDKKIFVLTNRQKKLLGIIWVNKKDIPKQAKHISGFDTTFAIRLYGSARGKKLALPFMREVFKKLSLTKAWLVVLTKNIVAINLYKKFGFNSIYTDDKIQIMTYEKSK